jgi:coenzyme F420-0:L-glutamate ligase/coenzyme F420-1:gamma-L-glutamate ligase
MCPDRLELIALSDMPLVAAGDDLAELIADALQRSDTQLDDHDVLVVAQKIVSKAEGRLVDLATVVPSEQARRRARQTGKDPRLVELILRESVRVVRQTDSLIITENTIGIVMANSGVDQSNIEAGHALLLPEDPDRSAVTLRQQLMQRLSKTVGVVIADSMGRAWRKGIVGHAIGVAGVQALVDLRTSLDLFGRALRVTQIGLADEIAAAATVVMGQGGEGRPVVLVRGFGGFDQPTNARELVRDKDRDLFR